MNDNVPATITMPADQARLLVDAGNLVSELWCDLHTGELTYADLAVRLRDAGLATTTPEGQPVLKPLFCEAVIGVSVALDHMAGDDDFESVRFDDEVGAAEAAFLAAVERPESLAPA